MSPSIDVYTVIQKLRSENAIKYLTFLAYPTCSLDIFFEYLTFLK